MSQRISMDMRGRITLPADVRRELGLEGRTEFEIEVERGRNAFVLRPAVKLPRRDSWAYTPSHRARLKQAHADSRRGRVRKMTEAELRKLIRE